MNINDVKIAVIGLGYVGLPLAVEFGKKYPTIGFDIDHIRVDELNAGRDHTLECTSEELLLAYQLSFTTDLSALHAANCYIVTVATPVDDSNRPNLISLIRASETVGKVIAKGDVVIYESTVYPGATEEDCIPVVERISGLKYNVDFFAGYSPERINPGDKQHRLTNIVKITSGSTPEISEFVDKLYRSILMVETHKAPSIKVAEAAKVIENTQRDVNIALVNELAMVFSKMGIDTLDVLEAAGSKWNFLPFRPGLVGGHCIGVDPYYLSFKAQQAGYYPELISAQRRVNDRVGHFVVEEVVKLMLKKRIHVNGSEVLVLGVTFKEDCPDVRNTKVIDIVKGFQQYGCSVTVCDPWADPDVVQYEYGEKIVSHISSLNCNTYSAVVLAVSHVQFKGMSNEEIRALCTESYVVYDIKGVLSREFVDARL